MKTVSQRTSDFFSKTNLKSSNVGVVVTREDGIAIYSSLSKDKSSYSALMAGIWQASRETMGLISENLNEHEFRLSFDTSSSGLLVLPLEVEKKLFLLGAVYTDQTNPAQVKVKLRVLRDKLSQYLRENKDEEKINKIGEKAKFLFKDISDDEMDNLFSFVGD